MAAPALRSPSIRSNTSDDPFNGTPPTSNGSGRGQHRYSSFDTQLFSQYTNRGSPTLAKRSLHDSAVQEQKAQPMTPTRGVNSEQTNNEVGPELRQRLVDLEQEYNDMGRETARLSPRKISYGIGDQAAEGAAVTGDGRSSPSKPQPASRRQRNAPSGRVHDIEFATEISTSLLAQLRHLQGILTEKEEALKRAHTDNAKLQQASDRFDLRLRELDDTEQKYKEQMWQLESQVQDLSYQMKDAAMREQRLTQHLNAAKTGRSTIEREYDELRQSHDQLYDEHSSLVKSHDSELDSLQRALASGDNERIVLNKRIEELMEQHEHMERSLEERLRAAEAARDYDMLGEGDVLDLNRPVTPDGIGSHSPVKATPRVGGLEAETLKSSLNHAHRMIQNLKNNIHREKTEKQELKRMLQDARDELEARKADVGGVNPAAVKRRRQNQQDNSRKPPRPGRLGAAGGPTEEIINDATWEEYDDNSPTRPRAITRRDIYDLTTDASDAFETANEEGTETEGFQTADDRAGDSEGDVTETESTERRRSRNAAMVLKRQTSGVESTASDDDDVLDLYDLTTPPGNRNIDRISNVPGMHSSPASFVSHASHPRQNLAAELDNMDNSSIAESTPGQRTITSRGASPQTEGIATPISYRKASLIVNRAPMVDSGMMTEPWSPKQDVNRHGDAAAAAAAVTGAAAGGAAAILASTATTDDSTPSLQIPDGDLSKRRSFDPAMAPPPLAPSPRSMSPNPASALETSAPVNLTMSQISSQHTEPVAPSSPALLPAAITSWDTQTVQEVQPQTISAPAVKLNDGVEPSPVSAGGVSAPVSAVVTPVEEKVHRSMDFVQNVMKQRPQSPPLPVPVVKPEETRVRDFAMTSRPGFGGFETDKVLLEPHLRVARDQAPQDRQFQEPTLQISTPNQELPPFVSQTELQYIRPTTAEKGKARAAMVSSAGTQTTVSADQIENLLKERRKSVSTAAPPPFSVGGPSPARSVSAGRSTSLTSVVGRPDAATFLQNTARPTSSGSGRRAVSPPPQAELPPLPADHREVIAAAARTTSGPTNMAPPMPPSAWRPPSASRNRAQSGPFSHSPVRGAATPRHSSVNGRADYGTPTPVTRRSSQTSFHSELDPRYGAPDRHYVGGEGFEIAPNTDPRMIQAITQTMIGEFLWKYTRKAGRGEHSENRHKRFFWIHPYTRTLYWSNQDPSLPSQKELKAKSVAIEAVRVVSDENQIPQGLHNKSLVVVTPSRSIKFTAPTPQRHETWFNALSYLLLRKDPAAANDPQTNAAVHGGTISGSTLSQSTSSGAGQGRSDTLTSSIYTAEDIAEFNPQLYPRSTSASRMTNASRRSLGSTSVPATPRSNQGGSMIGRTASPQRSTPNQASLAARQSSANQSVKQRVPVNPSYAPINSIAEDRPLSSGGFAVPALPASATTNTARVYTGTDSPTKASSHNQNDSTSTTADDQPFGKTRPISGTLSTGTAPETATPQRTSRLGSLTGGWRASLFGRGRSKSRGRSGPDDGASLAAAQADGAGDVPPIPAPQLGGGAAGASTASMTGGWGGPAYINGVENVRACCDGKHDVSSLDHHHHSISKGRNSSRSRSRPGSSSSRYSHMTGNWAGSTASRTTYAG